MAKKAYKPHISVTDQDKAEYYKGKYGGLLTQQFKGEVTDKNVKFPKDLGVEHPFDFEEIEKIYKNFGPINGIIDKYVDSIVGDFSIKVDSPQKKSKQELSDVKIPDKVKNKANQEKNAQAIIDNFIKTTGFTLQLRDWIREGCMKGNGYMELDLENTKIRVLNAKHMYIKRTKKGIVKKYNQWIGDFKRFSRDSTKFNDFEPNEIAHLPINLIAGEAYGLGFMHPNMTTLNFLMGNEVDVHKLITRKAGAPIHVKIGQPGEIVNSADIDDFKSKLQFMQTRTEWVTDGTIEMNVIDFGQLGKSLTETIEHDLFMLCAGTQMPEVLMGSGQLNEGIANVQLEGWQRKIRSIQEAIESIVEEKIFKPILNAQGFDLSIEFIWNLPGEEEKNRRLDILLKTFSSNVIMGENLKRMNEIEYARVMDYPEEWIQMLREPEMGLDEMKEEERKQEKEELRKAQQDKFGKNNPERKEEETKMAQPEVPGSKPNANAKHEHSIHCMHGSGCGQQLSESEIKEMDIQEWVNLQEFENFNYQDYLIAILQQVEVDKFETLAAKSEADLANGLLPPKEIEKLRIILKNGFKNNKTIREIEREIERNIPLGDKKGRAVAIARTETVRLANMGLLNHYQDNKIGKVRFLAALSERTCPICEELNSQVFTLNESAGVIPVHSLCRCSWIPVVE